MAQKPKANRGRNYKPTGAYTESGKIAVTFRLAKRHEVKFATFKGNRGASTKFIHLALDRLMFPVRAKR